MTYDWSSGSQFITSIVWLGLLFVIVMALPNSLEVLKPYQPALDFQGLEPEATESHGARPILGRLRQMNIVRSRFGPALIATLAVAGVFGLNRASGFLYWQF